MGREPAAIAPEPAHRPRRDPSRDRHRARRQQPRRVLLRTRDSGRTADRVRRLQGRERSDEASSGALPRIRTRRRRTRGARAHRARRDDRVDRAPRQQEGVLVPVRDGARHPRGRAHLAAEPRLSSAGAPRAGDRPRAAPDVGTQWRRRAVRHRHLPGPARVPGRAPHRCGGAPARPRRPGPVVLSQRPPAHDLRQQRPLDGRHVRRPGEGARPFRPRRAAGRSGLGGDCAAELRARARDRLRHALRRDLSDHARARLGHAAGRK